MAAAAAALLNAPASLEAADLTWSNVAGGFTWATPGNWSPAGPPGGADNVLLTAAGKGTLYLGGATQPLNSLQISSGGYGFSDGGFSLNSLRLSGTSGQVINLPIAAAGTTLTTTNLGDQTVGLRLDGPVTTTNLTIGSGGGGAIGFDGANTITGTLTVSGYSVFDTRAAMGSGAPAVVMNSGGRLSMGGSYPFGGSFTYATGVTVNGDSKIHGGRSDIQPHWTAVMGPLSIGAQTLTTSGNLLFNSVTFSGSPTFNGGGVSLGAIAGDAFALNKTGPGTLTLTAANSYSGGTNLSGGTLAVGSASGALGSGPINVSADGWLQLQVAQASFPTLSIPSFAGLGGNLTGAVYSGPAKNVTLADDAVLFNTNSVLPVRGVDVSGAPYWKGVTTYNGFYTAGDAGTSIYKGVLLDSHMDRLYFAGTIREAAPGSGVKVYHNLPGTNFDAAATFNSSNTGTGIEFLGPQKPYFYFPVQGTATVFTFAGNPAAQHLSLAVVSAFSGGGTIPAGKKFNISNGIIEVSGGATVAGTVNVNTGGTLMQYPLLGPAGSPTTGTFNINDGGIAVFKEAFRPGAGATFNFAPGSQIHFAQGFDTGAPGSSWMLGAGNADLIVAVYGGFFGSSFTFGGSGLILGQNRRIFFGRNNPFVTLSGGAGISAAPGATDVIISAWTFGEPTVADAINLAGVNLQVNDTAAFQTMGGFYPNGYQRAAVPQDGTITLTGATTAAGLTLKAGTLNFGNGSSANAYHLDSLSVTGGSLNYKSGTLNVAGPLSVSGGGSMRIAANLNKTLKVDSVSVADAGSLDLTNNKLVVTSQPLAAVEQLVVAGHNDGAWDGVGIVTSQSDAATGLSSLGVATAEQTGHDSFGGVSVSDDDVLVMYTYAGDANLDGFISGDDYSAIDFASGIPGAGGWFNGDFTYDGFISGDDYTVIDFNLVAQGAPFPTTAGVAAVPEPASGLLVLLASPLLGCRRRSKLRNSCGNGATRSAESVCPTAVAGYIETCEPSVRAG